MKLNVPQVFINKKPNKSIKFAHKKRGLGLGDKARLAPYFKR